MTIHSGSDHCAACGIMTTIITVCIGHTTSRCSIPLQISPVLAKGPAKTAISGRIHTGLGTGKEIMQTLFMGVSRDIVLRIDNSFGEFL